MRYTRSPIATTCVSVLIIVHFFAGAFPEANAYSRDFNATFSDPGIGPPSDSPPECDVTVANDTELSAAIAEGSATFICLAPGTYSVSDMVAGIDRTSAPLTIQAQDPSAKPVFEDATQSLVQTRYVTFRNLGFVNTGALGRSDAWIHDGGGNGGARDTHHIKIEGCDFSSPPPSNTTSTTPDSTYADGMPRLFQFSNYATHTYAIRDITASHVYQVGDFRMNGDVLIDNVKVDFWYFDGIRIIGSGEEGYVDGDRIISRVDLTNNIAVYNEQGGQSPHPDNTQMFNTGSSASNTNPRVQNLLFYRNRFNPGQFRSTNTQSGLTQSYMINVGYVENLWSTKSSPHGISIEGGGSGVLIERNTLGEVNWIGRPWIRLFRVDGQILIADTFFPGGINDRDSGNLANHDGFELDLFNVDTESGFADLFQGPPRENGIPALVTMFTPVSADVSVGPLNAAGQWRGGPHRPMRASAPTLSTESGMLVVEEIHEPTLQSPDQSAQGGDTYTRYDLRWSTADDRDWMVVEDVSDGDLISVPSQTLEVQTRCVNGAGEGLWSATSTANMVSAIPAPQSGPRTLGPTNEPSVASGVSAARVACPEHWLMCSAVLLVCTMRAAFR